MLLLMLYLFIFQLSKYKEALDFAVAAHILDPSNSLGAEKVDSIKKQLDAGLWLFGALFILICMCALVHDY